MTRKKFEFRGEFQRAMPLFALERKRAQFNVDMGLGKTVGALTAVNALYHSGFTEPTLVIGPKRVAQRVWSDEVAKWDHLSGLDVSVVLGTPEKREKALKRDVPIYTINYENVKWLWEYYGAKWPFKIIIADESTKLKSNRSCLQVSTRGKTFVRRDGGMAAKILAKPAFHAKYWFNLTGSFGANSLHELWPQLWYIDGGKRLGNTHTDFMRRWFREKDNGYGFEPFPHAEAEIRALIEDVCFTLRAEDYFDLPDEVLNTIWVDLPAEQRALYRQMERKMFLELEQGDVEVFTGAAKRNKLQQMANGFVYTDDQGTAAFLHEAKIEALREILEGTNGTPLIIAYKFKEDLAHLRRAFPEGKDINDRGDVEGEFKAGKLPLLFLHPKSAAHGIDGFQHVTNIGVLYSVDDDNELRSQVIARIGKVRQMQSGYNRPVFIHQIVARNTVDEDILENIEGKYTLEESLKRGLARRFS